jgi:hypothetical protein
MTFLHPRRWNSGRAAAGCRTTFVHAPARGPASPRAITTLLSLTAPRFLRTLRSTRSAALLANSVSAPRRGGRAAVSLTEAAPDQVRALHKYMSHLVRWDFEPYAVCIALEAAVARGAVQVAYVNNPHYWRGLPEDKRWWFQPTLRGSRDITLEKEWRFPGDANLAEFPQEDVAFIVASRNEAEILRTCTPCRVEHLFP